MASTWLLLVKKYNKIVAAEIKAGTFTGDLMKEAIKRAKAEFNKSKGKTETKDEDKEETNEE